MDAQRNMPAQPKTKGARLVTGYAILGSALAWAAHLSVMYFLVQPVCRLGGETMFHITTVVALLACLGSGIVAWRHRGDNSSFENLFNGNGTWKSFVALFGVVAAAMFAYAIIYQWSPVLTISACEGMRPLQ